MTMRAQYFVPFMHTDGRVLGFSAISLTTYNGNETTVTLGGIVYPARKISYMPVSMATRKLYNPMEFLAATITPTEYRRNWNDKPFLLENIVARPRWSAGQVTQFRVETPGDLDFWLLGGAKSAAGSFTPPTVPGGSNVSRTWLANSPFSNTPRCEFFDINWQTLSGVTAPERIQRVALGAPSADPGNGASLKAVLVTPGNMPNAGGFYTDVRIVRVSKGTAIPTGTYTWPLQITDVYDQTSSLNVSVVVA